MHHLIYPVKDTYISNRTGAEDKNFGIDEILQVGTENRPLRVLSPTKDYYYTNVLLTNQGFENFTGTFTGSFGGNVVFASGSISGSNLDFSASYFSGSINGVSQTLSASVVSGSLVNGYVTGSITAPYVIGIFTGQLTGSDVCLTGTGSGKNTLTEDNWTTTNAQFVDRALLMFDLRAISTSLAEPSSSIRNPHFHLKMKVCNEYDLPITYTIYAFPISQSWNKGDGYWSDGGSDTGVSWMYRNNNYGTQWYNPTVTGSRYSIDFINSPTLLTASFGYGGGTWYTSSWCSQSFCYESSDINLDVTSMVLAWISSSIPNEGMILVTSDELQATGSGFLLKFFSRDTNTIYSPYLDAMWTDSSIVTGSQSTGSVTITSVTSGITASVQSGSSFTIAGGISGSFSASAWLTFTENYSASVLLSDLSASGLVNGKGLSGNINGLPVVGFVSASVSVSESLVTGPCGKSFYAQMASASFYNGIFSGSTFTAYYVDYKFENAFLTGSWTEAALLGATVTIPLPSAIAPYAYAYVVGTYVNGTAMGNYVTSGSTSASFNGQFIDGNLIGGVLNLQLSGNVYTASFQYTSSVTMTSSFLSPLDSARPFTISLQNICPTYKAGDIAKIGIFGRKQFPLKTFGRSIQQEQYLVPEFLPTSSYYALKDNETEEIVLDFDSYTQISCEYPGGNYFMLDTTSLPQDRYYRVLVRISDGNSLYTIDSGKTFKVTR